LHKEEYWRGEQLTAQNLENMARTEYVLYHTCRAVCTGCV